MEPLYGNHVIKAIWQILDNCAITREELGLSEEEYNDAMLVVNFYYSLKHKSFRLDSRYVIYGSALLSNDTGREVLATLQKHCPEQVPVALDYRRLVFGASGFTVGHTSNNTSEIRVNFYDCIIKPESRLVIVSGNVPEHVTESIIDVLFFNHSFILFKELDKDYVLEDDEVLIQLDTLAVERDGQSRHVTLFSHTGERIVNLTRVAGDNLWSVTEIVVDDGGNVNYEISADMWGSLCDLPSIPKYTPKPVIGVTAHIERMGSTVVLQKVETTVESAKVDMQNEDEQTFAAIGYYLSLLKLRDGELKKAMRNIYIDESTLNEIAPENREAFEKMCNDFITVNGAGGDSEPMVLSALPVFMRMAFAVVIAQSGIRRNLITI